MMDKRGVASAHVPKAVYYATTYKQGSAELLSSAVHILGVSINIPQVEADVKRFLARFPVILFLRSAPPNPYMRVGRYSYSSQTKKVLKGPLPVPLSVALRLWRMVRYEHVSI